MSLFSRACIRVPLHVSLLLFLLLLGLRSLGMAMFVLHFLYLARLYTWNVGNVWFTFLFYVIVFCMMNVYLYMLVYGWLCTLYDGLSWLREWPSLVMRAFDLVVWVCAQGDCRRCIFMLFCVHDHRSVIVLIHVTQWHWFSRVCDMHQHTWYIGGASAHLSMSMLIHVVYTDAKPYWCTIAHQMRNFAGVLLWKWGIPTAVFSWWKFGENSVLCAMMHLRRNVARFLLWKFGIVSKCTEKALTGTMHIPKIKP